MIIRNFNNNLSFKWLILLTNIKLVFLLLVLSVNISVVNSAREPPTVTIPNQGQLVGMYMKMFRTQRIVAYLGIPYAVPPINERRFAPPVVDGLPAWDGIRNATEFQRECWSDTRRQPKQHEDAFQKLIGSSKIYDSSLYDEDCLYLNIYIPDEVAPAEGYAVIVWLHSGDFVSGNSTELNPFHLVFKQKLIVITVAYRIGIFGFFTSMDGEAPGNFGLMDQAAALLWVNRNIELFGGNIKLVTLMGHGAGAVCATLHLTSGEWSAELFDQVIIMSGTSLSATAVREPKTYANAIDQVATAFGCYRRPTSNFLECLRRADARVLMEGSPSVEWGPIIDDGLSNTTIPFIPEDPRILVEKNALRKVPVMIGFTNMEDSLDISMGELMEDGVTSEMYETLVGDIILNELSQLEQSIENGTCGGGNNNQAILDALNFVYKPYPPVTDPAILRQKYIEFSTERNYASPAVLLATHMSKLSETYVYRFDIKPKTIPANDGLPNWAGVPHGYDLIFVWGFPYWIQFKNQTTAQWDTADKRVADIIMTLWANFAKYAEPTKLGVYIKWDPFTPENQGVLIIDRSFNMSDSNSLNYQAMQFWNDYYPKVVQFASQCCNYTDSANTFLILKQNSFYFNLAIILLAIIVLFIGESMHVSTFWATSMS